MTKLNWRDASKELPKAEEHILMLIDGDSIEIQTGYYDDGFYSDYSELICGVTHWIYADEIPLPED